VVPYLTYLRHKMGFWTTKRLQSLMTSAKSFKTLMSEPYVSVVLLRMLVQHHAIPLEVAALLTLKSWSKKVRWNLSDTVVLAVGDVVNGRWTWRRANLEREVEQRVAALGRAARAAATTALLARTTTPHLIFPTRY
jgi:hypothetical protein